MRWGGHLRKMTKTPPFLVREFSEIVGKARAYGVGKSIAQIAARNPKGVSLSTLKAVEAGRHVRPQQLKLVAELFEMRPLDWIEAKIRYVESYLEEYLVSAKEANDAARIDLRALNTFAAFRTDRIQKYRTESTTYHQNRLKSHVELALQAANKAPMNLCDKTGVPTSKKDKFRVKYATVTALNRGEHIRPEKLGAICRRVALPRAALSALKITYAEAYLGEYLLGDDIAVLAKVTEVDYPRTTALLIFSTKNPQNLA